MSSIDNRIVEMQFDNKQFESGIQTSTQSLKNLEKSLKLPDAGKSLDNLGKSALTNGVAVDALTRIADAVTSRFSVMGIIGVTALQNIANSAINAGKQMIKSLTIDPISRGFTKYEQKTASVQTIMNATGDSVERVNEYLDRLMWFSDETSYGFTDMTGALAQMTSTGGDVANLIPLITGVANATAYAGKGASEFSRAMYNINQSYGQGSLSAMDFKSLEQAGVASKELKQVFIDTGVALKKIKKGEVDVGNFSQSLKDKWADTEVMEAAFGKFSELSEAAYTAVQNGEYETAGEAIQALASDYSLVSQKAFKSAQSAKTFSEAINATKDAVSTGWMKTAEIIFGNITVATDLWSKVTGMLWDIFASGAEGRNDFWAQALGTGDVVNGASKILNILNRLIEIGGLLKETLGGAFTEVFGEIKPIQVTEAIYGVIKSLQKFINWLKAANGENTRLEQIGKIFKGIFSIFKIGLTVVQAIGNAFWNVFKAVAPGAVDGLLTFFSGIGDSITEFANNLSTNKDFVAFFEGFGNVLSWFVKQAPGWWASIVGFFSSDKAKAWYKSVTDFFEPILKPIRDFIAKVKSTFLGLFGITEGGDPNKTIMQQIQEKLGTPEGIQSVVDNIKALFAGWGASIKVEFEKVKAYFKPLTDWIGKYVTIVKDFLSNLFGGVGEEGGVSIWDQFKGIFGSSKDIKELADGVIALVTKVWADLKQKIIDIFTGKKKGGFLGEKASAGTATDFGFKGGEDKKGGFFAGIFAFLGDLGKWFGQNWGKLLIGAGLIAITAVLVSIFKFVRLFGQIYAYKKGIISPSKSGGFANSVLKIAGAIVLIVGAIYAMTLMVKDPNFDEALKVIGGIAAVLFAMSFLGDKFSGKNTGKTGGGMLAIAGSVLLVIFALKEVQALLGKGGDIKPLIPALTIVGTIMIGLWALNALGGSSGGIQGNWKSILGIAFGVWILVKALKPLADMEWSQLGKMAAGLGVLTLAIGALVFISKIGGASGGNIKGIIGLAIGMWLIIKAIEPLANYDDAKLIRMGEIFGVLTAGIAIMMAASSGMSAGSGFGALLALGGIAGVIFVLGDAMSKMKDVDPGKISAFTNGLALMIGVNGLFTVLLSIKGSSGALAGLGSAISSIGLAVAIEALANGMEAIKEVDPAKIEAFMKGAAWLIGITGGTTGILAIVGAVKGGGAASALAGLGTALGDIGLAVAIEALANGMEAIKEVDPAKIEAFMKGAAWLIGITGGTSGLLAIFGTSTGGVGSALAGLGTAIGDIGLAIAIEALANGMEAIKEVDPAKIEAFMKGAAWLIGITGVTTGLLSLMPGVNLLGAASTLIGDIGLALAIEALTNGMDAIKEVDTDKIDAFMEGARALIGDVGLTTGLLSLMPILNLLGAWSTVITYDAASNVIGALGTALAAVGTSGVTVAQIEAFTAAVDMVLNFANNLKEKGLLEALSETIFGSSVSNFANDIRGFATGLNELTLAMSGIKVPILFWIQSQVAIMVSKTIVKFLDDLEATKILAAETGAPVRTFNTSGELKKDLEDFASGVAAIATSLAKTVGLDMEGLTEEAIGAVTSIATFLTNMSKPESLITLEKITPWKTFWGDTTATEDLKTNLLAFAAAIGPVSDSFAGIVVGEFGVKAAEVVAAVTEIANFLNFMGNGTLTGLAATSEYQSAFNTLTIELPELGRVVGLFNTAVKDVDTSKFTAVIGSLDGFVASLGTLTTTVTPEAIATIKTSITELSGLLSTDLVAGVTTGIQNGTNGVLIQIDALCSLCVGLLKAYVTTFVTAGFNLVQGLANGIKKYGYLAVAAARIVASNTVAAAKEVLREGSPSRAFEEIGMYTDVGFANGLLKYGRLVTTASTGVAKGAITAANSALTNFSTLLTDGVDTTPTIRPVVDLTDVTRGANTINGIFGQQRGINVRGINTTPLAQRVAPITDGTNANTDILSFIGSRLDTLSQSMKGLKVVMNNGVVVGQLKGEIDRQLGIEALYKGRG